MKETTYKWILKVIRLVFISSLAFTLIWLCVLFSLPQFYRYSKFLDRYAFSSTTLTRPSSVGSLSLISALPGSPQLGSVLGTFVATFGQPDKALGYDMIFFPQKEKQIYSISIDIDGGIPVEDTPAINKTAVNRIQVFAPSETWSTEAAAEICNTFLPAGTRYFDQYPDIDGSDPHAIEVIYTSQILKNIFSPSNSNLRYTNRIRLQFLLEKDAEHIGACEIEAETA